MNIIVEREPAEHIEGYVGFLHVFELQIEQSCFQVRLPCFESNALAPCFSRSKHQHQ